MIRINKDIRLIFHDLRLINFTIFESLKMVLLCRIWFHGNCTWHYNQFSALHCMTALGSETIGGVWHCKLRPTTLHPVTPLDYSNWRVIVQCACPYSFLGWLISISCKHVIGDHRILLQVSKHMYSSAHAMYLVAHPTARGPSSTTVTEFTQVFLFPLPLP